MATMDRRAFLGRTAAFAGAGLFSAGALETLMNRRRWPAGHATAAHEYGPLFPVADRAPAAHCWRSPRASPT